MFVFFKMVDMVNAACYVGNLYYKIVAVVAAITVALGVLAISRKQSIERTSKPLGILGASRELSVVEPVPFARSSLTEPV